jgi:NADH-quinone oxidoreductase subunit M
MSLITFGSLGLPGLVGFWGEFLIIKGTFINDPSWAKEIFFGGMTGAVFFRIAAIIAGIGMILTAAYLLWMIERVFLGNENPRWKGLSDLTAREYWSLAPIAALVVFFGVYPTPILTMFNYFTSSISSFLLSLG